MCGLFFLDLLETEVAVTGVESEMSLDVKIFGFRSFPTAPKLSRTNSTMQIMELSGIAEIDDIIKWSGWISHCLAKSYKPLFYL